MFRDKRSFRSIAFRASEIDALDDLLAFLPPSSTKKADQFLSPGTDGLQILHCFYYSTQLFTSRPPTDEYQERRRGKMHFRYNMYLVSITTKATPTYFLAVPFLPMALEIYPHLRDRMRGHGTRYQAFNLPGVITAVQSDKNMSGALSITRIKYQVDGDSLLDSIVFRGKEVSHSPIHKNAARWIRTRGPQLRAEQVRLTLDTEETHFTIEMDKFGHCKFWLSKDAANISGLFDTVSYLDQQRLVTESASFPYMRSLRDEEQDYE